MNCRRRDTGRRRRKGPNPGAWAKAWTRPEVLVGILNIVATIAVSRDCTIPPVRREAVTVVVTAAFATACGHGELTREHAAELIRTSPVFTDARNLAPTVTRSLIAVTGVRKDGPTTAYADFEYRFVIPKGVPLDSFREMKFPETARFRLYDDGWRLDEVTLRESLLHI